MKRTWTVLSDSKKRQALRDVTVLVNKGNSISKARSLVARTLGVRPNTVANWANKFGSKLVNTTIVTSNNGMQEPHITGVNIHIPGKGNITLNHELLTRISRVTS